MATKPVGVPGDRHGQCTDAQMRGSVFNFAHMLSNGVAPNPCPGDAAQLAAQSGAQPAVPMKPFTLKRAWKLRCSEIHVLAERAECRCRAARKHLVLADTVLFAEVKEPAAEVAEGEEVKQLLKDFALHRLARTMLVCFRIRNQVVVSI